MSCLPAVSSRVRPAMLARQSSLLGLVLTLGCWQAAWVPAVADDLAYREALATAVRTAAQRVLPSIVTIEIIAAGGSPGGEVEQDAPTSGVIVDPAGYVLASSLVVRQPAASRLVVLPDGSRHPARVVARDYHRDLVLLKIENAPPLMALALAGNPELPLGATTVAVGRYGTDAAPLISRGVLSARGRLDGIALQTDARISPAFYGGPLIDLYGNVLGILIPAVGQAGAADSTGWYDSGIAFAIPSEVIRDKLQRLKAGQDIHPGLIGIVPKSRDPIAAGTQVAAVRKRSPAEAAGIQAGDEVVEIDGVTVRRHQGIKQVLGRLDAGDQVRLKLRRDGTEIIVEPTLAQTIPPLRAQQLGLLAADRRTGAGPDATAEVEIIGLVPNFPAAQDLRIGDVIERLGDTAIESAEGLRQQLVSAQPESPLSLLVRRGDQRQTFTVTPRSIAGEFNAELPEPWSSVDAEEPDWKIEALKLPEAGNLAAQLSPPTTSDRQRLGLLILLVAPGQGDPNAVLQGWAEPARSAGVAVCAIAPEDADRWQPKELEVIANFAAAMRKQAAVDPLAVAVAAAGVLDGQPSAADSMALAVAISQSSTFFGVAVSPDTRAPAIRLSENEPATFLQILVPAGSPDELPPWSSALEQAGYPIIRGANLTRHQLLHWVRLLQAL